MLQIMSLSTNNLKYSNGDNILSGGSGKLPFHIFSVLFQGTLMQYYNYKH